MKIDLNAVFRISDDVHTRPVRDELVVVPLAGGIGKPGEELFVLNATGQAIWSRIDGKRGLEDILLELSSEFDAPPEVIKVQTVQFFNELLERHLILKAD